MPLHKTNTVDKKQNYYLFGFPVVIRSAARNAVKWI